MGLDGAMALTTWFKRGGVVVVDVRPVIVGIELTLQRERADHFHMGQSCAGGCDCSEDVGFEMHFGWFVGLLYLLDKGSS